MKKDGYKVISIVGFSGAGKSFIVNRWRKIWGDDGKERNRSHPPARDHIKSTQDIELTELMSLSRPMVKYLLVDIDGGELARVFSEQQDRAGETLNTLELRDTLGGVESEIYRVAIGYADAYVFVVQAAHTDHETRWDNGALDRERQLVRGLDQGIHSVIDSISYAIETLGNPMSKRDFDRIRREGRVIQAPVFVALSQADANEAIITDDPFGFATEKLPDLTKAIADRFDDFRFDFVSAFHGYRKNAENRVSYNKLGHSGVIEMVAWLDDRLQARARKSLVDRVRFLEEQAAMRIRSRVTRVGRQ